MGGPTTSFIADRPFLFYVMDTTINSIIFAGKLSVPEAVKTQDTPSTTSSKPLFTTTTANKNKGQSTTHSPSTMKKVTSARTTTKLSSKSTVKQTTSTTSSSSRGSTSTSKPYKSSFSEDFVNSPPENLKLFQPTRHTSSTPGPKFRSIKGGFFTPKNSHVNVPSPLPDNFKRTSDAKIGTQSLAEESTIFPSYSFDSLHQSFTQRQRNVKHNPSNSDNDNSSSDYWRHHVLLFT